MEKNLHTNQLLREVQIDPHQQEAIRLGDFTHRKQPRGFSVEIEPDPDPIDSVVTKMTANGSEQHYELILQIANNGTRPIAATIWSL